VDPDLLSLASNGLVESERLAGLVPGTVLVRVDSRYFRPTEVETLLGDAGKARERLGWEPTIGFGQLVHDMVWADVEQAQRLGVLRAGGYTVLEPRE
jgi:GDPmannose 4,6-dehydratase